jgi:acetoacetate decarboxylase
VFKFSENHNYLMPAHFGGYEGQPQSTTYHDVTSIVVTYETDRAMLEQYVPEAFEVMEPVLAISYAVNRCVDWMSGGSYNLIGVTVPVAYTHGRERLEGGFALVVWENKTTPILPGREITGIPKIFANIEEHHQLGDKLFTNASYDGAAFLSLELQKTKQMSPEELTFTNQTFGKYNWFGWRYIPNLGKPGAALSHATLYPQEFVIKEAWVGQGQVHWQALMVEQNATQAHIIFALSQLPIRAYRECWMTRGSNILRNDIARQLP